MVGLLQFLASIIIAGFLFCPGPQLVDGLTQFMERVFPPRGTEMVQLAGATVRNVSRGIIGISLLQSFLAGAGFLIAGIPAAGLLAFVSLVLAIVQIGPAVVFLPIIIWSWTSMSTVNALMFTAYMIPVGLLDNLLKPVLMARRLRHADASDRHWSNWRDDSIRNHWPIFWPYCSLRRMEVDNRLAVWGRWQIRETSSKSCAGCKRPNKLTDRPARQQLEG